MKNKLISLLFRAADRNPKISRPLHRIATLNWAYQNLKKKLGK